MRILVVGAAYMLAYNQRKWLTLLEMDKDTQVRIIAPASMPTSFGKRERELHADFDADIVPAIRTFFAKSHMTYLPDPFKLVVTFLAYKPDQIHIEEDPYSIAGAITVSLARVFSRRAKISFFLWDNLNRNPGGIKRLIKLIMNRFILRRADLVICGNREGQRLLHQEKKYPGRSVVLPQLGLTSEEYMAGRNLVLRSQLKVDEDCVLIGYVGRLVPQKGLNTLFDALAGLLGQTWKLLLLGSGEMEEDIRTHWWAKFDGRLIMPGAVRHEEVPFYIRALDVLTLPSLSTATWVEQFGIVLAQAMLSGVPCLGSSSGAIPDVIGPGGMIFKEGEPNDLRNKLRQLIESAELRSSLGRAAQEYASRHYTQEAVAGAYLQEFKRCEGTAG